MKKSKKEEDKERIRCGEARRCDEWERRIKGEEEEEEEGVG